MNLELKKNRKEECLSDLILDRRLLGELSDDEEQHARRHLFECSDCTGRLDHLRQDRDAFATGAPELSALLASAKPAPLRLVKDDEAPAPAEPPRPWLRWFERSRSWLAVAAIAASIGIVAIVVPSRDDGSLRAKGDGVRFGVFIKHGEAVREGTPGDVVFPGDVLRFSYSSDAARHVGVLSLDGAKRASIYFPTGTVSQELPASSASALPDGILLDEAIGREQIFGLFCDRKVDLEPLRAALEARGVLDAAPAGCTVERLELEKKVK